MTNIFSTPGPLPDSEVGALKAATRLADTADFPEGQEDPAQSAELERQQDA
jgi:hypothetical protein